MQTAILFLVFNRPEVTQRVFEVIRRARPPRLYVAADGPRAHRPQESVICEQTRKIACAVDWPCELRTLFRDHNLGCRVSVSTAIDWFFQDEETGIILEDDCLPDDSFIAFCEELLDTYEHDRDVMVISGDYFHGEANKPKTSYYFSRYNHCWGWATWRRAWELYDPDMCDWPQLRNTDWLVKIGDGHADFIRYWTRVFDQSYAGKIDSWAYRWLFSCWLNGGLTALPSANLVKNIGFGEEATHTTGPNKWDLLPLESLNFPILKPGKVERDIVRDRLTDLNVVRTRNSILRKVVDKVRSFVKQYFIAPTS